MIKQLNLKFQQDGLLTRDSLIKFLDLRWKFNGVKELQELFLAKRQEAVAKNDIQLFKLYVSVFESSIEERLQQNAETMVMKSIFSPQTVEESQDYHFNEDDTDFVWILNTDDYLEEETPEELTIEVAEEIYSEIRDLSLELHESEQIRCGYPVIFESEQANYIRLLALDLTLGKHNITERMLKKVFYLNHKSTVYQSSESLGSEEPTMMP